MSDARLPINHGDTGRVSRDKINQSFTELVQTVAGYRPHIENGTWWIGETNTGVKAKGDSISMKVEDGYIWYKSESENWTQIIAIEDLKGDKGDKGDPFTYDDFTPEQLEELTGPQGEPGTPGAPGTPGQDGEDGEDGNGISNVVATKSGKITTVVISFTDGRQPYSFQISDGADGEGSGDMVASVYDPNNKQTDAFDYNNMENTPDIPSTAADVGALPDSTKYGASLDLRIDSTTYVITAQLKDQDGNNLGTPKTVDLPLESVVVSGSYNPTTKKVVLTLQSGSTIEFSVADLVAGLQSEITSTNKLDSDLVDDTNQTHKFVTAAEKSTWSGKQDAINDLNGIRSGASAGATALQPSAIDDTAFGVSWNNDTAHAPSKNAVYGVLGGVETLLANI